MSPSPSPLPPPLTSVSRGRAQRQEVAVDRRRRRRREEEGVGNSTVSPPPPVPSSVVMAECRAGQARQGQTSWGRCWLQEFHPPSPSPHHHHHPHPPPPPQQTHGSSSQTVEGENGNVCGGMNHCSCADGRNESLVFRLQKKKVKKKTGRNI